MKDFLIEWFYYCNPKNNKKSWWVYVLSTFTLIAGPIALIAGIVGLFFGESPARPIIAAGILLAGIIFAVKLAKS